MKTKVKKPSVTVLIPSFNEEKNIRKIVIDSLKINDFNTTVLVVIDSKTTDKTAVVAKQAGAQVVTKQGDGKGVLVKNSLKYLKSEFVVQIDADYQFIPQEISLLVNPLMNGYDVALGTRYSKGAHVEEGSVSLVKLIGSYFLSFAASIAARKRVTDVMAGFKAFKTDVLKDLDPQTEHFGYEAELVVRAAKKGYNIINVPITYKRRDFGKSSVSSIKHGFLVLGTIIKTALE